MFLYHGPLLPHSPLFRGRGPELARLSRLCKSDVQAYAIVYGGRQSGKTSLLMRLEAQLPEEVSVCRVDFQGLPGAGISGAFHYLAEKIAERFSLPVTPDTVHEPPRFVRFLREAMQQLPSRHLVLMLEELGALPSETRHALANVLRSVFTNRHEAANHPLGHLMVVLSGSIELYDLAVTDVSTLHNICDPIHLPDLSRDDGSGLIRDGLREAGLPIPQAEGLGDAVWAAVNGQPYLTQRLGAALVDGKESGVNLTPEHVAQLVEGLLLDDPLLIHWRRALDEERLWPAVSALLDERPRYSRLNAAMARLELLGVARPLDGRWVARNPLLERALRSWLNEGRSGEPQAVRELQQALVRVLGPGGQPVGMGFLAQAERVLTCAHVVKSALGLTGQAAPSDAPVRLDWPLLPGKPEQSAHVGVWQLAEDLAVLYLAEPVPGAARPAPLANQDSLWGHPFRAFGCPAQRADGVWSEGVIRGPNAAGWVQLDGLTVPGYGVLPGFSGGPVWDDVLRAVVGMVVAAESQLEIKSAQMIPAATLARALRL